MFACLVGVQAYPRGTLVNSMQCGFKHVSNTICAMAFVTNKKEIG